MAVTTNITPVTDGKTFLTHSFSGLHDVSENNIGEKELASF